MCTILIHYFIVFFFHRELFQDDDGTDAQSFLDDLESTTDGGRGTRLHPDARVLEAAPPGILLR